MIHLLKGNLASEILGFNRLPKRPETNSRDRHKFPGYRNIVRNSEKQSERGFVVKYCLKKI